MMRALPPALAGTKKCPKCNVTKDINIDFSRSPSTKDGAQGHCRDCKKQYYIKSIDTYRNKHKEKYAKYSKEIRKRTGEYYRNNTDKCRATSRARYHNLPEEAKTIVAIKAALYAKLNPGKAQARVAMRRSKLRKAAPNWLTDEHNRQITEVYEIAKQRNEITPNSFHVDHIVPIRGKIVCGLHVPWNLQILSAADNIRKSNAILDEYL